MVWCTSLLYTGMAVRVRIICKSNGNNSSRDALVVLPDGKTHYWTGSKPAAYSLLHLATVPFQSIGHSCDTVTHWMCLTKWLSLTKTPMTHDTMWIFNKVIGAVTDSHITLHVCQRTTWTKCHVTHDTQCFFDKTEVAVTCDCPIDRNGTVYMYLPLTSFWLDYINHISFLLLCYMLEK